MHERDAFITFINQLKAVSPTITDEQRKGFLRLGVQQHGLTVEEAMNILNAAGLTIGERIDYFEVLGISIDEIQRIDELAIVNRVEIAHKQLYAASLRAGGRPRSDGRSEDQWRTLLNQARDTLIEPQKRNAYLDTLLSESDRFESAMDDSPQVITETQSTEADTDEPAIPEVDTLPGKQNDQTVIPDSIQLITDVPDDMSLIPAGEFRMGSNDEEANDDEQPVHTVFLDAFLIDKYPVTNEQFKGFVDKNPQWRKPVKWYELGKTGAAYISKEFHDGYYLHHWNTHNYLKEHTNHPVVHISWYAALAYAQWVGKRLPTEAEWEKAARGGLVGKKYPWGDIIDSTKANFGSNVGSTIDVGNYLPNGYDVFDITGNVSEWCLDEFDREFYRFSNKHNPVSGGNIVNMVKDFTKSKASRVIRGGSWYSAEHKARVSNRDGLSPRITNRIVGFRCVKPITT